MGNFDRQLANALSRVHRQMFGGRMPECRWYYSSKQDLYHCPHTAIFGKDLILEVPEWRELEGYTEARDQWDNSPERDHTL